VQNCKQVCLLIIERKNSSRSAYATTRSHTRALTTACFEVECWHLADMTTGTQSLIPRKNLSIRASLETPFFQMIPIFPRKNEFIFP
jgi:hypothetical protein